MGLFGFSNFEFLVKFRAFDKKKTLEKLAVSHEVHLKGGVSQKIFFSYFFSDFNEISVSNVESQKILLSLSFLRYLLQFLRYRRFFGQNIYFLPRKAQTLGTYF